MEHIIKYEMVKSIYNNEQSKKFKMNINNCYASFFLIKSLTQEDSTKAQDLINQAILQINKNDRIDINYNLSLCLKGY